MAQREVMKSKQVDQGISVDLGDATSNTKGYNFDYVQEIIPLDKKYNRP